MLIRIGAWARYVQLVCGVAVLALAGCDSNGSSQSQSTSNASATTTTPSLSASAATSTTSISAPKTATPTPAAATSSTPAPAAAAVRPAVTAIVPSAAVSPSLVTTSNNADACLPLTMPSADSLFGSPKKVFAHYFFPFPVSIDNAQPENDYYNANYLNRHGEANKWLAQGGFLRTRPLGTTPLSSSNWKLLNMEAEVRAAIARGITGFTFDVFTVGEATDSDGPLNLMLAAAHAVDSRFKIIVMPDITVLNSDSAAVVQIIAAVASSPAAYHLSDGRLVVSAFDAGLDSAGWWQAVINQLSAKGVKIAFVPTFLSWTQEAESFASISYGFGDWGTATSSSASGMQGNPESAQTTYGKIFMMPVDPQQYRPKDFAYWEAGNSTSFRNAWISSIHGDADWVQLVTWNDYSESSQVAPYTDTTLRRDIGTGYYDLNGFYAAWFSSGQEPQITHDVLYYFYRREPTSAAAPNQQEKAKLATGSAENDIELVALLTEPGVLTITIGDKTYTQNATAGVNSFKVPSQPGTPRFTLSRNGSEVFSFEGGVQIYGASGLPSGLQDLTYWSGSAARSGVCSL
jgi:hypothetical protein